MSEGRKLASGIEVSVAWETPTVFAGEELRCTITFKNTRTASSTVSTAGTTSGRGFTNARERWKKDLPQSSPTVGTQITKPLDSTISNTSQSRHRPKLSISAPVGTIHSSSTSPNSPSSASGNKSHKRSVSIISIGSQAGVSEDSGLATNIADTVVARNGHGRSASLHGLPFRKSSNSGTLSSPLSSTTLAVSHGQRSTTSPLPAQALTVGNREDFRLKPLPDRGPLSRSGSVTQKNPFWKHIRSGSEAISLDSRLAMSGTQSNKLDKASLQRQASQRAARSINSNASEGPSHRSVQRIIAPTSTEGTPRSSMDIYSHSNASSETMQSEYLSPNAMTPLERPFQAGSSSYFENRGEPANKPETLMMAYVQLNGSFVLDGSLVNLGPFETVKRKGIIGGQASGGVVGLINANKENSLLSSFGWGSIGQSIGTFLGSEEPSSFRDMKGLASTKAIPILSTAQSILFVNLELQPGERRSFSYSYQLPLGIPPSFKGRAFKSSYSLIVGTQRSTGAKLQQTVSKVEVPFKVLPSINNVGEVLGHDLMSPHIVLKDMSVSKVLDSGDALSNKGKDKGIVSHQPSSGFEDYANQLLADAKEQNAGGLLSPTAATPRAQQAREDSMETLTMKQLIEVAISTQRTRASQKGSFTTFHIHRTGHKVAKVSLNRAGFRLGETVIGSVDFDGAELPCYTVNAFLETSEAIEQSIAIRSMASIHRATRRVHAQVSQDTTWARKITFGLTIPPTATPEFLTTGVSLEWKVRIEFVTSDGRSGIGEEELLEIFDEDDRGQVLWGTTELACHAFEVPISIRVYGSTNEQPDIETSSTHMI